MRDHSLKISQESIIIKINSEAGMRDTSNYRKTKKTPRLIFSDFKFYSEAGLGDTSK